MVKVHAFLSNPSFAERPLIDIFSVRPFPHSVGTVLAFNLVSNYINGGRRRRSFSSNLLLHHMGPSEDYIWKHQRFASSSIKSSSF